METLHFEDFAEGRAFELGSREVTAEEIAAFAGQWDPQPFHLDEAAARASPFGGLVASGWHTCAVFMRLLIDGLFRRASSMGSPGVDSIRWPAPVRPGDRIAARAVVLSARPSRSRPDRGIVVLRCEARNGAGEPVLAMEAAVFIGRRPGAGRAPGP